MNRLTIGDMQRIKSDCQRIAPGYLLVETDAFRALESGYGNCFAKAILACGIVVLRHNIEPSLAYSAKWHGVAKGNRGFIDVPRKPRESNKPSDPDTGKVMSHVSMLVPGFGEARDERVIGIHFGTQVKKSTANTPLARNMAQEDTVVVWEDFNSDEVDAMVKPDGEVVATTNGRDKGFVAGNWRNLGQAYLTAIDRPPLDSDLFLERMVEKQVISLAEPLA